jgi:hypothetical protein
MCGRECTQGVRVVAGQKMQKNRVCSRCRKLKLHQREVRQNKWRGKQQNAGSKKKKKKKKKKRRQQAARETKEASKSNVEQNATAKRHKRAMGRTKTKRKRRRGR